MTDTGSFTRAGHAGISSQPFGITPDGEPVVAYTLTNARGTAVRFITLGGIITSVWAADRDGAFDDVVLGHDTLADYLEDPSFLGALIGRFANRIAGGRFRLEGEEHVLEQNEGVHHLHGGSRGFHRVVWDTEPFMRDGDVGVVLRHVSAEGEDGYPGNLAVRITYTLTADDALVVDYHAHTDRATPVNMTQHLYFNLAGHDAGDVLGHTLTLNASRYTPVDAHLIPTGELRDVAGTPFDFTRATPLGERVDADDEQLRRGDGYDHNFVLDRPEYARDAATFAARLREPVSGRTLDVLTTEPGLHLYSGNGLGDGPLGKAGHVYRRRCGVALETQHFPDSPNQPHFPSTILRAGDTFTSRSVYRFSVT